MLARLAASLRSRQPGDGAIAAGAGENTTVVLDDNCLVRFPFPV